MIEMKKVEPVHDLDALAEMAHDIWFEYWPAHIDLTVNKGNELGIRAYKGNGFDIIESVEADIGNGFVMDDYIMACAV